MSIDEWIFGIQPTIWFQQFVYPIAVDYFMIAYSMFFIYPFFYLIFLLQKNQVDIFQKVLLAQILALIISLGSFLLFPALGPRFILNPETAPIMDNVILYSNNLEGIILPLLYNLTEYKSLYAAQYDLWNFLERVKTDCFPSMHTCLCLICLFYALRFKNLFKYRRLAIWFWIFGVASLIFSTVYLRYHWVIDVITGIILAIVIYFITEWIFNRWVNFRIKQNIVFLNVPWFKNHHN
ncbi:phosphatase PAP2 family protein [Calditrichota bacterium]